MVTPEEARRIADAVDKAFLKVPAQALRDLASQVESLQADAERYRWVREKDCHLLSGQSNPKKLDAAIDEARKQS